MAATSMILTKQQVARERVASLTSMYQGADRMLAGERVVVESVAHGENLPAAWTDGGTITFNLDRMDDVDISTLIETHGLNFHELCHILWTPRRGTSLVTWVIDNHAQQAFNILEDQRIESLMVARYPSCRPWLTTAILKWIVKGGARNDRYLFVRGRRFLDGQLRGALRSVFGWPELLPEVDRIIDRYRKLVFPLDYTEAQTLIADFHNLLQRIQPTGTGDKSACPYGHGPRPVEILIVGRPKGLTEQQRAQRRMDDGEPEADVDTSDDGEPYAGEDAAKAALVVILDREDVIEDLQRSLRTVKGLSASDLINDATTKDVEPLPAYRNLLHALSRTLERLVRAAEPGWDYRQPHGRVNVLRWERDRDIESAFDVWDEGVQDAVDMEVVVLLDDSGSTAGVFEESLNAMWVTKRALDRIGASTTVITFSDSAEVLYHRRDRAETTIRWSYHGGGTQPLAAVKQAAYIFARTRKTQRILVVFTDGEWSLTKDKEGLTPDDYIARMSKDGVTTALGFFFDPDYGSGNVPANPRTHHCSVTRVMTVDGLVPFVRSIVVREIQMRMRRRAG